MREQALDNYLDDTVNAWELQPDGVYRRLHPQPGAAPHSAQQSLLAGICG